MLKIHLSVLIICSIIGFTGHYLQFGVARLTPWIPAGAGLFVFTVHSLVKNKTGIWKWLPVLLIAAFGILTTNMWIRFLQQDFQPLRKKMIFGLMSTSAWLTVVYTATTMLTINRQPKK